MRFIRASMTLPEGLWLLPDRHLAIGQKQINTLCVLSDSVVKQSSKYPSGGRAREIKTQRPLACIAWTTPIFCEATVVIKASFYPAPAAATPKSNALRFDSKNACFVDLVMVSFSKSPSTGSILLPISAPSITIFNESAFPA